MNPLFDIYGQKNINNSATLMRQIQEFKNSFKGNPKEEVQRLLNSGQMSQTQFNEYSQQAQQILSTLTK